MNTELIENKSTQNFRKSRNIIKGFKTFIVRRFLWHKVLRLDAQNFNAKTRLQNNSIKIYLKVD